MLIPAPVMSARLFRGIIVHAVARRTLMPAITRATDTGAKPRFQWRHGVSVVVTPARIAPAGIILSRFVAAGAA